MLIIEVKEGESIDRALRRYRRKHQRTQLKQEIMRRKHYTKPSARRRKEVLKAIYRDKKDDADT